MQGEHNEPDCVYREEHPPGAGKRRIQPCSGAGGANAAVDEYRRRSHATVKSQGIYGDCLREAKFYAKHSGEKPVKEKAKTKGKK
jgi:hypothetical protein